MRTNKTFFESIYCACVGFIKALKIEKNFRNYFLQFVIFNIINIAVLKLEPWQIVSHIIVGVGVLASEFINTAIEQVCNKITKEYDEEIKTAKDISATAVLIWGILYYGLEIYFIVGVYLC